jgi:hypothetical protein
MKLVPVSPLPAIQYVEMKSSIQRTSQKKEETTKPFHVCERFHLLISNHLGQGKL